MEQRLLFSMAIKNLWRHKRRTLVSIIGVSFSVGILFFALGFYRGTYDGMMFESYIRYKTGHINIQTKKFEDGEPENWVKSEALYGGYNEIVRALKANPSVKAVGVRLSGIGFIGDGKEKYPVSVVGVQHILERNFDVVASSIQSGQYLTGKPGIILGKAPADLLGLKVGDFCYVQVQTLHGSPNMVMLPVEGIFTTGFKELDKNTVFVELSEAQALYNVGDQINKSVILLNETAKTDSALSGLTDLYGVNLSVKSWREYGKFIIATAEKDKSFFNLLIIILVAVSISTVMGAMLASVYERTREIGTLRAMGWSRGEVRGLFLRESFGIGVIGAFFGLVLGGIPSIYMMMVGVDFSAAGEAIGLALFRLSSQPRPIDALSAILVGILSTFLGGWLPAHRASKLAVVDCLKVN